MKFNKQLIEANKDCLYCWFDGYGRDIFKKDMHGIKFDKFLTALAKEIIEYQKFAYKKGKENKK